MIKYLLWLSDMEGSYSVDEFSGFSKLLKKVMKKFSRTFDDDFKTACQVLCSKLPILKGNYRQLPKTDVIAGLGSDIKCPCCKTEVYIEEAKKYCGRLIYFVDTKRNLIFLVDVYYKTERENHDPAIIQRAYLEFVSKYPV
jgi:hypothetical protein